jgi:hypothetical protein
LGFGRTDNQQQNEETRKKTLHIPLHLQLKFALLDRWRELLEHVFDSFIDLLGVFLWLIA